MIRFGRKKLKNKDIHIVFNEESTSRHHCSIEYNEQTKSWYIIDGDDNKQSTNGTWYLIENEEIYTGMKIRVGTTTFEAIQYKYT